MFNPYMNYPQSYPQNYPQFQQQEKQAPIQNIFTNQMPSGKDYFMARFLRKGETPQEEITTSKTALIDLNTGRLFIKEGNGEITDYEIKLPLDEKDKKILEQENQINSLQKEINQIKEMMSNVSTNVSANATIPTNEASSTSTKSTGSIKKNGSK